MKKLMALALSLIFVFSMTALAEDDSLKRMTDSGKLILGLDDSFPPMGFNNEKGEIVGFDIDLATEVCARLGVELVLQPIDWSAKETLLENGNIDCIWNGMSITPAREESMCMTPAYLNNRIVILTKKDSGIQEAKDLAGKYVAVQSGSFAEEVLTLAQQGTVLFEKQSGTNAGRLVNVSGRQRVLSQRMAKFYMASTLQVDVDTAKTEIAKARSEFISAQELLRKAPEATPRIKDELDLANGQWVFFDQALQRPQSANPRALSDVFFSSENLLSAMDRVTGLYSAVKA